MLSYSDVSLSNKDTSMVNGLGKVELEDFSLESSFHENLGGELKNIIEGVLFVSHKTISLQAANKRRCLE